MRVADRGDWLRETCLTMAVNNHTPADFWLGLPLRELIPWVRANNKVHKQRKKK